MQLEADNNHSCQKGLAFCTLAVVYMAAIYWMSSLPGYAEAETSSVTDIIDWTPPALQNLLHIPLFGVLAWLWYRTLNSWHVPHGRTLFAAFILAAAYGFYDEWHQLHVPGRSASFTDIALNCIGVAAAVGWIHWKAVRCCIKQEQPN